jgi:transcriptional antiterminator Rof (Rho-off)
VACLFYQKPRAYPGRVKRRRSEKLKYSRDNSFLFSDGDGKRLKVGAHHVEQSNNRKSESRKVEYLNHNYERNSPYFRRDKVEAFDQNNKVGSPCIQG